MMNRMIMDHIGRYAQRGWYLAENKKRIEREGTRCDNCDSYGGPYGICDLTGQECEPKDTCNHWKNSALSPLIKVKVKDERVRKLEAALEEIIESEFYGSLHMIQIAEDVLKWLTIFNKRVIG